MKFKTNFLAGVIFFLIVISFGCKKTIFNETKNTSEEFFFKYPSNNYSVKRLIDKIHKQEDQFHFIDNFMKSHGTPYWSKAIISNSLSSISSRDNIGNSDTSILVPVVSESDLSVNSVISCVISNDSLNIKLINSTDYKLFDSLNLEYGNSKEIASLFMIFEKNIFGKEFFEFTDLELAKKILGSDATELTMQTVIDVDESFNVSFYRVDPYLPLSNVTVVAYIPTVQTYSLPYINISFLINYYTEIFGGGQWWNTYPTLNWPTSGGGTSSGGSSQGWTAPPCGTGKIGDIYIKLPCSSNGGSISLSQIETFEVSLLLKKWDDTIRIDPTILPCFDSAITNVKNIQEGTIARILFHLDGTVPTFRWEIRDTNFAYNPSYQNNLAVTINNPSNYGSLTYINEPILSKATEISIASCIIHESVHAFLTNYVYTSPSLTQNQKDSLLGLQYSDLLKEYLKLKNPVNNDNQHIRMINRLRNDIKAAILQFINIRGYVLSESEKESLADAMSWQGLNMYSVTPWTELTDEERSIINARIKVESESLDNYTIPGLGITIHKIGIKNCL